MNDVIRFPFIFFWMSDVVLLTLICKHCARSLHMDLLVCTWKWIASGLPWLFLEEFLLIGLLLCG